MDTVLFMVIVLGVLGIHLGCSCCSSAAMIRIENRPRKSDGSLSFLVIGDWGRNGHYNQSLVAQQMGRIGEELDVDFVISTGDNFYENGLRSTGDEKFVQSFTNIYTAESLNKQWYSVLGNHDYRGDVLAQLSPALPLVDRRWFCMRSFVVDAEIVQIFFVDTTPFEKKYWMDPTHDYDWRGVAPRNLYISNLLKELDSALKAATAATWKIVVGHHTIRSVSEHGETIELVHLLLPVLKANDVDLYVNGHDHCLGHISSNDSPVQFLTSGGGSKAWRGVYKPTSDKLRFFYDGQGFMSLQLSQTELKLAFYDVFGDVLHDWSLTKELRSSEWKEQQ